MSSEIKRFYEFENFRFDAGKRVLWRNDEMVNLTPKAGEVLLLLLQSRGNLLERDEILEKVWPGTFVEEGNLNHAISALRKALGSDAIQTVPRRGYRFTGEVREAFEERSADLVVERRTVSQTMIAEHEFLEYETAITPQRVVLPWAKIKSRYLALTIILTLFSAAAFWYFRSASPLTNTATKTIAILPLQSLNEGNEDAALSLGLTENLASRLGNLEQLIVRPTASVKRLSETETDPLEVGKKLKTDIVITGSFQRNDGRIRMMIRLLRVDDGTQIWAGNFDEVETDFFKLQDSLSAQAASFLIDRLTPHDRQRLASRPTENLDAYQAYLKGRYYWNKRTVEGLERAIIHFDESIRLDPRFALPYAGLADVYVLFCNYNGAPPVECFPRAKSAALKAVELDASLADPHTALAVVNYRYDRNWAQAESEFKQALALNPKHSTARQWYGEYLGLMGRHDESIRELQTALELDPLSLAINSDLGAAYHNARRYDEAIEQLRKTVAMDPKFPLARLFLGMAYKHKGMQEQAFAELEEAVRLSGRRTIMKAVLGNAYGSAGRNAEAIAIAEELTAAAERQNVPAFELALIYIGLERNHDALQLLEKSYREHEYLFPYLKVDPNLDPVRGEPQFIDLLKRAGL
jgi:DNA-binding winged helix-turn-helix (wHTH) protein/TolB-like protein